MKLALCLAILLLLTAPLFSIVYVTGRVVGSDDPETASRVRASIWSRLVTT